MRLAILALALAGCPFCNSGDVAILCNESREHQANEWFALCADCGAQGPKTHFVPGEVKTRARIAASREREATELWNERRCL